MPNTSKLKLPDILFEDPHLLVINKPAGLLSVRDGYDPDLPHVQKVLEPVYGNLWMVHRLDKSTSGVLVLARDPKTHRLLNHQFREREIHKTYHALATPIPNWRHKALDLPLKPDADRMHRTRVDKKNGREAHSIFTILKIFDQGILLDIQILTGITHQIRAHLRSENIILFGETLYNVGLPQPSLQAPRMMLHARNLVLNHPLSEKSLNITAPYPRDFREFFTKLKFATKKDNWI